MLAVSQNVIDLTYLLAAVLLIIGIKQLSSPRRARSGNLVAAVGMTVAVVFTLLDGQITTFWLIAGGVALGTVIGAASARLVKMTAMPQMVALFNGVGGGAAALIAAAEFHRTAPESGRLVGDALVGILFSALIGSVSFSGSLIAFGKLQELLPGRPITFKGQQALNGLLAAALLTLATVTAASEGGAFLAALLAGSLVLGVLFVLPIGGADMPVVISLLNAFTGLAAASTGFVLDNTALIIGGTLVGASGTLLTMLMARAMGRSVSNILFGAFGKLVVVPVVAASADGQVRTSTAEDIAVMLAYAKRVVIVPGYGLAVAQAQHEVRRLADELEKRRVDVRYAIHPVAGRMPGHMNVLLAEANVPYTQLYEMEQINPEFERTDVALVVGANDVTNPAARNRPGSPIYGMPILDVDKAKNVVFLKRSLNPGFAGIDNDLFTNPKTVMLFGDAKDSVLKLIEGLKSV